MGKNTRGVKEFTREQRLINENKRLKKELTYLRKQISRLDGDRFETLRQMCADNEESQKFQEKVGQISSSMEDLKKEWGCNKCSEGVLEITLYSKLGETHYYRSCNSCENRTKGQRYDATSVKGIIRNGQK